MMKFTPTLSRHILRPAIRTLMLTLFVVFGASAALAQTRAYVANAGDNTVSVIDTATNSVITTVPVGLGPTAVAVTPNGRFVYVVNQRSNDVSVISAVTNTVIATVPVGLAPSGLAITPNGAFAYVSSIPSMNISVIDTATNTVVTNISAFSAFMLAILPNGTLGYLTHAASANGVDMINIATNTVFANIPIPVDVTIAAAATPNSAFLYVTCLSFSTGSKLAVIDTATSSVVAIVPLPANTFSFSTAVSPDGAFAYVANNGSSTCCGGGGGASSVSVIDTASNTEIATVPVGSPSALAVTPDGAFIYVTNEINNTISVIRRATLSVVAVVPVGTRPGSIAIGTLPQEPQPETIASLIAKVQALITAGTLTQEQGAGLIDKLQQISAKIDAGQTGSACNQWSAFINQVNGLINTGALTPAQGQVFIDGANALKTKLGC